MDVRLAWAGTRKAVKERGALHIIKRAPVRLGAGHHL